MSLEHLLLSWYPSQPQTLHQTLRSLEEEKEDASEAEICSAIDAAILKHATEGSGFRIQVFVSGLRFRVEGLRFRLSILPF